MRPSPLSVLLAVACGGAPAEPPVPAASTEAAAEAPAGRREDIDVETLAQRLAEGDVVLIDVRSDAEWASGHVPGAVHVPVEQVSPEHPVLAALPKDRPVHFICAAGGRSATAADRMAAAGWHAVNVEGGTRAWKASGRPVE